MSNPNPVDAPTPQLAPLGPLGVLVDASVLSIPANQQPTCNAAGAALPSYLVFGTLYSFPQAGDSIGLHAHEDGNSHYSAVLAGTITYNVQNSDGSLTPVALPPMTVMLVPPGVTHSFVAVTAGAVLLNMLASAFNPVQAKAMLAQLSGQLQSLQTALTAVTQLVPTSPCAPAT